MNISPKYIKMCKKADEIQQIWTPRVGDWTWRGERYLPVSDTCGVITDMTFNKTDEIWLPRQDQLQEILGVADDLTASILEELAEFRFRFVCWNSRFAIVLSGEELWFMFVMYKKFNKIWDEGKEEWIKLN